MSLLTNGDKILIRILYLEKSFSAVQNFRCCVNFQQETGAEVRFAMLLNSSTQRATLVGKG